MVSQKTRYKRNSRLCGCNIPVSSIYWVIISDAFGAVQQLHTFFYKTTTLLCRTRFKQDSSTTRLFVFRTTPSGADQSKEARTRFSDKAPPTPVRPSRTRLSGNDGSEGMWKGRGNQQRLENPQARKEERSALECPPRHRSRTQNVGWAELLPKALRPRPVTADSDAGRGKAGAEEPPAAARSRPQPRPRPASPGL